jgi:hypothetical protein
MKADTCIAIIIGYTGVNVTSGQFTAAGVIETGGKFAIGVNDTGGKCSKD